MKNKIIANPFLQKLNYILSKKQIIFLFNISFHLKQDFPWNFYRTWNLIILKARYNNQKEWSLSIIQILELFELSNAFL